jgi:hypothetical protein
MPLATPQHVGRAQRDSGTEAAAAVFPSTSSNSWHSSLSSRKPQAAASPFNVCTVRRRLRAVSASPGDFSSCIASSFSFWTSSPARFKKQLAEFRHPVVGGSGHAGTSTRW